MFATRVYPCFTEWYNMFYQEGKKVLPLDLYNMLTYEALAHWIMGDGTKLNQRSDSSNSVLYYSRVCIYY